MTGFETALVPKTRNCKIWGWQSGEPGDLMRRSSLKAIRLKTQEEPVFQSESKGQKRPMLGDKPSNRSSLSLSLFVLVKSLIDWLSPIYIRKGDLLYSVCLIRMLLSSRNTLTDTPSIMFSQMSGYPVAQSSWHIKLTITRPLFVTLAPICIFLNHT